MRHPRVQKLERDMALGTADGMSFCVMVGTGQAYFGAFTLALGLGEVFAGLIAPLPNLVGAVLQLMTPWGVERLRSAKRWTVLCVAIQAMSFAPLIAGALLGALHPVILFAAITLHWGAGLASGPSWSTFASQIYPKAIRTNYFARRTRWQNLATLSGTVFGGLALAWAQRRHGQAEHLWIYAVLFGTALLARVTCAVLIQFKSDPGPPPPAPAAIPSAAPSGLFRGDTGRLLSYMLAVTSSVAVSGSFFTPYMLGELELPYWKFMVLISTSFFTKAVLLPHIGRLVKRIGSTNALLVGGIGIVPLSALWMGSASLEGNAAFAYLVALHAVSGTFWAVYEMSTLILLFDTIPPGARTNILTKYNLASASAGAVGATLGGALLAHWGSTQEAYLNLFLLSTLLRGLDLTLLLRVHRRRVKIPESIPVRPIAVGPPSQNAVRPILPAMADAKERIRYDSI